MPTTSDIAIRRAGPGDAPMVRDLTRTAYAKWVPLIGREPLPMTADYDAAVVAHRIDLLFVGELPAALIEMIIEPGAFVIENLAVLPSFQGRGLGRCLLGHAEAVAASHGHGVVRLYTNKQFAENLRLYERFGYRVDREEVFLNGTVVHLSKPVSSEDQRLSRAAGGTGSPV